MRPSSFPLAVITVALSLAACQRDVTRPDTGVTAQTVTAPSLAVQPRVSVTLVPGLPLGFGSATGINDLGQVVGTARYSLAPIYSRPFVWSPGSAPVLLDLPQGVLNVQAYDINDAGTVVGNTLPVTIPPPVPPITGVRWSLGGSVEVVPSSSYLFSVNELGWAVGQGGVLSPDNVLRPLYVPEGGTGSGWDINNAGQVTGGSRGRASLWEADGTYRDLGAPPGPATVARGITEGGHVVGRMVNPDGSAHAFIWTPELGLRDLGGASPFADGCRGLGAQDISERDEVVGMSTEALVTCNQVPFYWSEATGFVRLPAPTGYETWSGIARRINNKGQIVGDFSNRAAPGSGENVAVLWEIEGACAADPVGIVAQLSGLVASWRSDGALNAGNANALDAKLSAAARSLAGNRVEPARGQLAAFLNQLDAFVQTGKLTQDAVEFAVTCARQALEQIARQ